MASTGATDMGSVPQTFGARQLHIFISYPRENRDAVRTLQDGLEMLNHEVWFDQRLNGGQDWWDRILQRIRECDVMIVAVSPALLESDAAAKERTYARQLGKPVLPVQVEPVLPDLLPPDIASLQIVDYTSSGPMTGFQLAAALAALPAAPPIPDPPPQPPSRPMPPLAELAQRVTAANLSLEDQLALVSSLRFELDRARERAAAIELLQSLRRRRDLYHATWQELDELLRREGPRPVPDHDDSSRMDGGPDKAKAAQTPTPAPKPSPAAATGWYPDPSRRHQFRWFELDWTPFVSDNNIVSEDPNF